MTSPIRRSCERRRLDLRCAGRRPADAAAGRQRSRHAGSIEKSNVRPVVEMSRMIELTRAYTEVATLLQQQGELRKNSIQQLAEVPA